MSSNGQRVLAGSRRLQTLAQHFRLQKPPQQKSHASFTKQAAVLVCLFKGDRGELRVILTKRASTLSSHSGEVALPGGKVDEGDADYVDTALREAKEEIGLDPSLVIVVMLLEPLVTKEGVLVVPVVGVLSDKKSFSPTPNASEVEAVFDVPLEMFLKNENRREEEKERKGEKYLLHFFDFEADHKKFVIWAFTAAILIKAASEVYHRRFSSGGRVFGVLLLLNALLCHSFKLSKRQHVYCWLPV